jgi:hypothetical protein
MNSAVVVSSPSCGATCLTPVPAPTGHPRVVAPHHLPLVGVLDHGCTLDRRVEGLLTAGADEPRRAAIAGEVLAAEWELVEHRDRVVDVGDPVDSWQPLARHCDAGNSRGHGDLTPGLVHDECS